jgi:hypothetical protein
MTTLAPAQHGHPAAFRVRLHGIASHSWSSATGHFHQTFLSEPAVRSYGVKEPFLVGCHSAARDACVVVRQFDSTAFRPRQHGQPAELLVLLCISAIHSWSSATGHFHQTFLWEPALTLCGERPRFFSGCHWAATAGCVVPRQFDATTFWPAQQGHPDAWLVRLLGIASHSWSSATQHSHQTFLVLPATMSYGLNKPFLVGCHCAANSGKSATVFVALIGSPVDLSPPV